MQLPFVLQSAEVMKTAVAFLEQFMEKSESSTKGTMVLATVKGTSIDIGKKPGRYYSYEQRLYRLQSGHQTADRKYYPCI